MMHIIGEKPASFFAAQTETSVTFDALDFSVTGKTKLGGPFSLALEIRNTLPAEVFIGVEYTTDIGAFTLAERVQIGTIARVPAGTTGSVYAVISGASVPPLGRIDGIVTSITVRFYIYNRLFGSYPGPHLTCGLRIDEQLPNIAALERIGIDAGINHSGIYAGTSVANTAHTVLATTTNNLLLTEAPPAAHIQYRLQQVHLETVATSFPGDLIVWAQFVNAVNGSSFSWLIARIYSEDSRIVARTFMFDHIYIAYGSSLEFYASNVNSGADYVVHCATISEILFR